MKLIQLTNHGIPAYVDDEDYEVVVKYKWYYKRGYAATNVAGGGTLFLHQLVFPVDSPYETDHIDRNKLNCQKGNLRQANALINRINRGKQANNSSGYKGVSFYSPTGKWRAYIGKPQVHLGFFQTIEEAVRAYNVAATTRFGKFAVLNPLPPTEQLLEGHPKSEPQVSHLP